MSFIFILFVIALLTALMALIWPLVGRSDVESTQASPALAVYRAQLAELDRDAATGAIPKTEAAAARHEIERRILTENSQGQIGADRSGKGPTWVAAAVILPVILLTFTTYLFSGRPDLESRPMAQIEMPTLDDLSPSDRQRLGELQTAADAGGAEAWTNLARFYLENGLVAPAKDALFIARDLAPDDASIAGLYGEVLFFLSQGFVTQDALDAFRSTIALDPTNTRGRFYLAAARQQAGYPEDALDMWATLLASLDPADPWTDKTVERIEAVALSLGADPVTYIPSEVAIARGGALGQSAISQMSPEDRQATIHQMVDRLAARLEENPDDLAGWMQLARSRMELGEHGLAARAFARADGLARQTSIPFLMSWAAAIIQAAQGPADLPDQLATILDRVLAQDPDHTDALWYAGIMAARQVDGQTALAHWRRLLELLPQDSEIRPMVAQAIAAIGGTP